MKKILFMLIVICGSKVCCAQGLTLGGLGAGGLNGNGFGDPVANDYAGIDWGYNFQTGMIINGYDPAKAGALANSMNSMNGMTHTGSNSHIDSYFEGRMKNRIYRDREERHKRYRATRAYLYQTFEQYEAQMFGPQNYYR